MTEKQRDWSALTAKLTEIWAERRAAGRSRQAKQLGEKILEQREEKGQTAKPESPSMNPKPKERKSKLTKI